MLGFFTVSCCLTFKWPFRLTFLIFEAFVAEEDRMIFFFACIWINFSTYQKNSRWDCCVKMCTTLVDVTIGLSSAAAHVTSRNAISFYGRAEALSPKLVTKNIMVNECEVIFFSLCQIYIKYNSYNCQSHDHNNLKLIN